MSHIENGEPPHGVNDEPLDVVLFQIEMVPKWSERVVCFFTTIEVRASRDTIEEQTILC